MNIDRIIEASRGVSLLCLSTGLLRCIPKMTDLDKCSRINLNLGFSSSAFFGILCIYKSIRH